jgi:hypothetical protein
MYKEFIDPQVGWKRLLGDARRHRTTEFDVTYNANAQGFRGKRPSSREDGVERIAFLGDSFTFGNGVEDHQTFASRIESLSSGTRTYNFGVSGIGIDQMWMILRHYAAQVDPDVVVLSFVWDDLRRARDAYRRRGGGWWPKPSFQLVNDELVPTTADDVPTGLLWELEKRSHLFTALERAQSRIGRRAPIGSTWRLNRALFAAIRDECEKLGTRLVVVHLPMNTWRPAPGVAREFDAMGIEFVDLAQLDPRVAGDGIFYPKDTHLTVAGHRFVAEQLLDVLRSPALPRREERVR